MNKSTAINEVAALVIAEMMARFLHSFVEQPPMGAGPLDQVSQDIDN